MDFRFHPKAALSLDEAGRRLLKKVHLLNIPARDKPSFPSERPVSSTINLQDMVEEPIFWSTGEDGSKTIAFLFRNTETFGLDGDGPRDLRNVADQFLKVKWAHSSLSLKYIEEKIVQWCRESFCVDEPQELSVFLSKSAHDDVRSAVVWIPIAYLEVEIAFDFGIAKIQPISKDMIDRLKAEHVLSNPRQAEEIAKLFEKMRSEMQGLAAFVFEIEAEPNYSYDRGFSLAKDAAGLLRFFSFSALSPWSVCPNSPLGLEYIPNSSMLLFAADKNFSWRTESVIKSISAWSISNFDLQEMSQSAFEQAGRLIDDEALSLFQRKVRSSILTFTKGITLPEIEDRLVYTLAALESLFLKNSSEPIQQNLGERIAFFVSSDSRERRQIVRNIKDIYNMRSQYVHHRVSVIEEIALEDFNYTAWLAPRMTLMNIDNFENVVGFIDAIDERKFGGSESSGAS